MCFFLVGGEGGWWFVVCLFFWEIEALVCNTAEQREYISLLWKCSAGQGFGVYAKTIWMITSWRWARERIKWFHFYADWGCVIKYIWAEAEMKLLLQFWKKKKPKTSKECRMIWIKKWMGAITGQSIGCFGIREGQANLILYSVSSFSAG